MQMDPTTSYQVPYQGQEPVTAFPPGSGVTGIRALSASAIVAISLVILLFIGVVLVAVMSLREKKSGGKTRFQLHQKSTPEVSSSFHSVVGKLVLFNLDRLPDRLDDMDERTNTLIHKDGFIGHGPLGATYKASFQRGKFVVVKELQTLGRISTQREFEHEINRLCTLKHPNLVPLEGYYWSSSMKLLLSEYIPNGSLQHHLHERGPCVHLGWSRRCGIALGVAKALAYLHYGCRPRVLHCNVKATNILLGESFHPYLSDYGLLKLLPLTGLRISDQPFHTALGYVAPELERHPTRLSEECDVYAFGVLLMEMISGQQAVIRSGTRVMQLSHYMRMRIGQGRVRRCVDSQLLQEDQAREILRVLKVALLCTRELPSKRPTMTQVVAMLQPVTEFGPSSSTTSLDPSLETF